MPFGLAVVSVGAAPSRGALPLRGVGSAFARRASAFAGSAWVFAGAEACDAFETFAPFDTFAAFAPVDTFAFVAPAPLPDAPAPLPDAPAPLADARAPLADSAERGRDAGAVARAPLRAVFAEPRAERPARRAGETFVLDTFFFPAFVAAPAFPDDLLVEPPRVLLRAPDEVRAAPVLEPRLARRAPFDFALVPDLDFAPDLDFDPVFDFDADLDFDLDFDVVDLRAGGLRAGLFRAVVFLVVLAMAASPGRATEREENRLSAWAAVSYAHLPG